jgi:hypothetical protein
MDGIVRLRRYRRPHGLSRARAYNCRSYSTWTPDNLLPQAETGSGYAMLGGLVGVLEFIHDDQQVP